MDGHSSVYLHYCQCGGDLESLQYNWDLLENDWFPIDAIWDPVKKDFDELPTQWDCTRDII